MGRSNKPFFVDDLHRKHECYPYDESETEVIKIEYQGRSIRLFQPQFAPPASFSVVAGEGDFLFLLGRQLDEKEEDGNVIEGGDGILIVAHRKGDEADAYWVLAWHSLYTNTLDHLGKF